MEPDTKRILIIDDEPDFGMMIGLTLEQTGRYSTRQETDSLRAVTAAREFRPDLILLDVLMPGLDGGDVLAQLHADSALHNVPVFFLTALVEGGEGGAVVVNDKGQVFFGKPINFDRLCAAINEQLATAGA